jgi:hypothetical protein
METRKRSMLEREMLRRSLGLRMPRKLHFHALGQEPFASALPTTGQGRATALGAHAGAKTMLLFPCSLGSL